MSRVHRDTQPANIPRPLRVGDVVRDRAFPVAIDLVEHIDAERVQLRDDCFCLRRFVAKFYEHADGAPISEVLP